MDNQSKEVPLWKDQRISAINRVIFKKKMSTEYFLEEYTSIINSAAKTKSQYKQERKLNDKAVHRE